MPEGGEEELGCRLVAWCARLEDPEVLGHFVAWLSHPSCGLRMVSAIRSLYSARGVEWIYPGGSFLEELHHYAAQRRYKHVLVPKIKYDIWDACASWVLGIPQHSAFVRLALGLSGLLERKEEGARMVVHQLEDDSFIFRDAGVTAVFAEIVKGLYGAGAFGAATLTPGDDDDEQLQRLEGLVRRRECSLVPQDMDLGTAGDFFDESELVCDILSAYFSSQCKEAFLPKYEQLALVKGHSRMPDPSDLLGLFFVTQAKISAPLPVERIQRFVQSLELGAQLTLRYGILGKKALSAWTDPMLRIAQLLSTTQQPQRDDNGAGVNEWLRNGSMFFPRRMERLQTEVYLVESAVEQMALVYNAWCSSHRGKLKHDRLLQLHRDRLQGDSASFAELLLSATGECPSSVFGSKFSTSFLNFAAAIGAERVRVEPAQQRQGSCTLELELEQQLQAVRLKALGGEYQVLQPLRKFNYAQDASINELLLVLLEDILDEEPGMRDFVDLPALDREQLEVDFGCSTVCIVARKELGFEVAHLYKACSNLPGNAPVDPRKYCRSEEQLTLLRRLLRFRVWPPFEVEDSSAPPFICDYERHLLKRAASDDDDEVLGLVDRRGVDMRSVVRALLQEVAEGGRAREDGGGEAVEDKMDVVEETEEEEEGEEEGVDPEELVSWLSALMASTSGDGKGAKGSLHALQRELHKLSAALLEKPCPAKKPKEP